MTIRRTVTPVCIAAVLVAAGCSRIADTILTVKQTAEEYSEGAVRQSVEGARAYCLAVPETRRLAFRAITDVAGKGPVLEVHCDRF